MGLRQVVHVRAQEAEEPALGLARVLEPIDDAELAVGAVADAVIVDVVYVVRAHCFVHFLQKPVTFNRVLARGAIGSELARVHDLVVKLARDEALAGIELHVIAIFIRAVANHTGGITTPAAVADSNSLQVEVGMGGSLQDVMRDVGNVLAGVRLACKVELVFGILGVELEEFLQHEGV